MQNIRTIWVPKKYFLRKMMDIRPCKEKAQMERALHLKGSSIRKFEYGHRPGIRVYKFVYQDGSSEEWHFDRR